MSSRRPLVTGTLLLVLLLSACGGGDEPVLVADDTIADSTTTTAVASTEPAAEDAATPTLPVPAGEAGTDGDDPAPGGETTTTIAGASSAEPPPDAGSGPRPDCSDGSCTIMMEGDSLTLGLADWFCQQVSAAACVNSGIGGNRIDQMIETARTDVDIHASDGPGDVLVLWAGTNDLWQQHHSGDPTANAEAAYQFFGQYIDERRTNGWDWVFVLTNPPANPDVTQGSDRLNELIRTNEAGADEVIDVAVEPRLADPFDPMLRAPDGVHYKDPGRQIIIEGHLLPAIASLAG